MLVYERQSTPWNKSAAIEKAENVQQVLEAASLDWSVESEPIFLRNGTEISGKRANVKSSDRSVLGVVSETHYNIVQNKAGFEFVDDLRKNAEVFIEKNSFVKDTDDISIHYINAGEFRGGQRVWLQARLPSTYILDEEHESYLTFSNSHDGKGSLKVAITLKRVACENALNVAFARALRIWSVPHTGDLEGKLQNALESLFNARRYIEVAAEEAEKLSHITVTKDILNKVMQTVFPLEEATDRQLPRLLEERQTFLDIYNGKHDIQKYQGTGYGLLNAITDFETHYVPHRVSKTYKEKLLLNTIDGFEKSQSVYHILQEAA